MRKVSILLVVGTCLVCRSLLAGPVLDIGERSVSADVLTPGGEAVFFYVARERKSWTTQVVRIARIESDDDGDGRVEFKLEGRVPFHSVWCVVDLATGEYDLVVPEGFPRKERNVPASAMTAEADGFVTNLRDARGYLDALLVRPGVGAWRLSAGDGAGSDDDGVRDGVTQVAFSDMQPVAESPPAPDFLVPGDTLVVVNPRNLEFFVTRISSGGK